jgi:hypothetical protein
MKENFPLAAAGSSAKPFIQERKTTRTQVSPFTNVEKKINPTL